MFISNFSTMRNFCHKFLPGAQWSHESELFIHQLEEFLHPITGITEIRETFPSVRLGFRDKSIDYPPDGHWFGFTLGRKPEDKFAFVSPSRNFGLFN